MHLLHILMFFMKKMIENDNTEFRLIYSGLDVNIIFVPRKIPWQLGHYSGIRDFVGFILQVYIQYACSINYAFVMGVIMVGYSVELGLPIPTSSSLSSSSLSYMTFITPLLSSLPTLTELIFNNLIYVQTWSSTWLYMKYT